MSILIIRGKSIINVQENRKTMSVSVIYVR
jgi:hypothetical protein